MVERLSQSDRFARLVTPLGSDALLLVDFNGQEAISDNFEWTVDALLNAEEELIDPKDIIGKPCHVEMDGVVGSIRYFHGLCSELRFMGWRGGHVLYRLVLRPWAWLLTRETACQIFHEKSVKDIIEQIFNDRGFSDFRFSLSKSYGKIPYCVQYQETTYQFASRLMEKYGLFFYFVSSSSKHEMVIVDDQRSLESIGEYSPLDYFPETAIGQWDPRIVQWQAEDRLRTAIVGVDDYNYEKPSTKLEKTGQAKDNPQHAHNKLKHYRYPAGHLEAEEGQLLADIFVDTERADAQRKFARGFAPLIHAGGSFKLDRHPVETENAEHFAVAAGHWVSQSWSLPSGEMVGADSDYEGQYEVADASKAYKAPRTTPWPRIYGAQTAEVIAKDGSSEEIEVDDLGRVLVRFHWNERNAKQSDCSCWVRVAQIWAGSKWGGVWIPRVGMEVVVEFLEGDPDRPLVTGCVYNGAHKMPYAMPGEKTKSTIKSEISKGGGGFNELRFEDKKGEEEIFVHAHRHLTTELMEGDETRDIHKGKRTTTIKMDDRRTITDGNDDHIIEKGNQTVGIKKGDQTVKIDMGDQTTTLGMGNLLTKMNSGKGTMQAMQSIEFKVGGSSIKIDPMKIEIKAPTIKINASMMLDAQGGINAKVQGGAMLTLKGGIVMIN